MPSRLANAETTAPARGLRLLIGSDGRVRDAAVDGSAERHLIEGLAIGAALTERVHPEDRWFLAAVAQSAAEAPGRCATMQLRFRRADDGWTSTLATVTSAGDGTLELILQVDDVAATRRAEAQLRKVVEGARQGISVRIGKRTMFANVALARMIGFDSVDQLLRSGSINEFIHPDDLPMVLDRARARASGADPPAEYEFRMVQRDGSVIWVDCKAARINWDGAPASLSYLSDVTARKRAEETHRRSEQLFSSVFQSSPDVMSLSTLEDGRFVDVNRSFLELHQLTREQVIGRTSLELGIFKDIEDRNAIMRAATDRGGAQAVVHPFTTPGGELRDFAVFGYKISIGDEDLLLVIGRDITERRRQEEELRRSKEAAELANRSKSEFLANMSHELRTPLNAIIGFSEIIQNQLFGPIGTTKYLEYAGDIYRSGEHLLQIINDILDLSKLEARKLELQETRVSLANVVRACVTFVRDRASRGGVRLEVDIPEKVPDLRLDERATKQILINLLSNAVKFTLQDGTVTVGLRMRADGAPDLYVRDTGIGMSTEDIKLALTPFGQVDSSLGRKHQGTGLGLPLARSLAELHGAGLTIESALGVGTTVTVAFPADRLLPPAG